jgi:hypothetical protein
MPDDYARGGNVALVPFSQAAARLMLITRRLDRGIRTLAELLAERRILGSHSYNKILTWKRGSEDMHKLNVRRSSCNRGN